MVGPPEPAYARRSGRVLVLDRAGRVLLLCYRNRKRRTNEWFTPGGGLADGEEPRAAAARELREETGLAVPAEALGAPVAVTTGYAALGFVDGWLRDDYFLHRVGSHRVDLSGLEPYERKMVVGHQWWSTAALAATREYVIPLGLAGLVAELAAGRVPAAPVRLPWHH